MTKDNCGCQSECTNAEHKVCLRHLVDPFYSSLPDNLKEMMHSLDQQKLAVLQELKKWAEENKHHEIQEACNHKMDKIRQHMTEQN